MYYLKWHSRNPKSVDRAASSVQNLFFSILSVSNQFQNILTVILSHIHHLLLMSPECRCAARLLTKNLDCLRVFSPSYFFSRNWFLTKNICRGKTVHLAITASVVSRITVPTTVPPSTDGPQPLSLAS